MKKFLVMFAIAGALVACNNSSESTTTGDTTTKMTPDTTTRISPDTTNKMSDTSMNKMSDSSHMSKMKTDDSKMKHK